MMVVGLQSLLTKMPSASTASALGVHNAGRVSQPGNVSAAEGDTRRYRELAATSGGNYQWCGQICESRDPHCRKLSAKDLAGVCKRSTAPVCFKPEDLDRPITIISRLALAKRRPDSSHRSAPKNMKIFRAITSAPQQVEQAATPENRWQYRSRPEQTSFLMPSYYEPWWFELDASHRACQNEQWIRLKFPDPESNREMASSFEAMPARF